MTIGHYIREARQRNGLSIEQVVARGFWDHVERWHRNAPAGEGAPECCEPRWRQRLNHRRSTGPNGETSEQRERRLSWAHYRYSYAAPGVTVDECGGNCPVQVLGTVDGLPFYFRARGRGWTFEVGESMGECLPEPTVWACEAPYGPPYSAGWMSPAHVRRCLDAAIAAFRARGEVSGWVELPPSKRVPRGPERRRAT